MNTGFAHSLAAQGSGAVFRALVSFLLVVYLGRVLGASDFGGYIATLNTAVLALILIEAGWPTLAYREGASINASAAMSARLAAHAAAAMLGTTLLLVALAVLLHAYSLAAAMACMGMVGATNLVSARMRGEGRFALDALWQISARVLSAVCIVACVWWVSTDNTAIFLAWMLALAAILLILGRQWLCPPQWRGMSASLYLALPFLFYDGLNVFLTKGDMAVLGLLDLPAHDLSWYAACSRFAEAALLLFAPITIVLLRHLRQATNDAPRFCLLVDRAVLGAFVAGSAALLCSLRFGRQALIWLFGTDYADADQLLPWIAAMLPFALANQALFQAKLARGAERRLTWLLALAASTFLAGLIVGAKLDGVRGAAIAMLAVQAALFVYIFKTRYRSA